MSSKRKKAKLPRDERWIGIWEFESKAFTALSADATRVYLYMRHRANFDGGNNGHIPFSYRDAAKCLHASPRRRSSAKTQASGGWRRAGNALAELQHFGFIIQRNAGETGPNVRLAALWQLTALKCGGQPASKAFVHWDGSPFVRPYRSAATRPNESDSKNNLPPATCRRPRRQHEGAFADSAPAT